MVGVVGVANPSISESSISIVALVPNTCTGIIEEASASNFLFFL